MTHRGSFAFAMLALSASVLASACPSERSSLLSLTVEPGAADVLFRSGFE